MITDSDHKKLIPSLAEVLAALKKVPAPHTYCPRQIRVLVEDESDHVRPVSGFPSRTLKLPEIELVLFRFVDEQGHISETWRIASMPEFHL